MSMRYFRLGLLLMVGVCVALLSRSVAGAVSEEERALLDEANAAYAEGGRRLSSNHDAAVAEFKKSAGLYRRALEARGGAAQPDLMYNLGNASLLAGDTGQAVLWYKRAERLMPNSAALRANLAAAREKSGTTFKAKEDDSFMRQLSLLEFVPAGVRFWSAAGAFGVMWALLLWRLTPAARIPARWVVGACGMVALLAAGSLVPREMRLRDRSEAVVVAETQGRAGPDEVAYEPKPVAPLKAGTEVRVVEERGAWVLVELSDGTRTWVEGKGMERVGA